MAGTLQGCLRESLCPQLVGQALPRPGCAATAARALRTSLRALAVLGAARAGLLGRETDRERKSLLEDAGGHRYVAADFPKSRGF